MLNQSYFFRNQLLPVNQETTTPMDVPLLIQQKLKGLGLEQLLSRKKTCFRSVLR